MNPFDTLLFVFLNQFARYSPPLDDIIIFFSDSIGYLLLAVLIFTLFFIQRPRPFSFLTSLLLVLSAGVTSRFLITELIQLIWSRPRPFEVLKYVNQLIAHSSGDSFPSGHAAFYFAVAGVFLAFDKRLGVFAICVAFLMGVARGTSGIHWPTDIMGGAVVGLLSAVGVWRIGSKLLEKKEP